MPTMQSLEARLAALDAPIHPIGSACVITAHVARQLLRYEPATGELFWLERPREFFKSDHDQSAWNSRYANTAAFTTVSSHGYNNGKIFNRTMIAHRVIWLLQTGDWPNGEIDHINGSRLDNRWNNLRDVSGIENMRNKKMGRNNTSGIVGVRWRDSAKKWQAEIGVGGKRICLGTFDDFDRAIAARKGAEEKYQFSDRHGLPRAPKPTLKPAADITKARGYSPALGAIYSPADTVNFLADSLEAQGVVLVRENGMFRTRNAAERAADAMKAVAA